jgi:hypothetical protein
MCSSEMSLIKRTARRNTPEDGILQLASVFALACRCLVEFSTRPFASALKRALWRRISALTVGVWRTLRTTLFDTYQDASTDMCKTLYRKSSKIFMSEMEAVTQSFVPQVQIVLSIALYMRGLLFAMSFDLRPSNQCILVRAISSLHFAKMHYLRKVSLLSRCSPRYLTFTSWGSCRFFLITGRHDGFYSPLLNQFRIAAASSIKG